jgi:hypothetical protein
MATDVPAAAKTPWQLATVGTEIRYLSARVSSDLAEAARHPHRNRRPRFRAARRMSGIPFAAISAAALAIAPSLLADWFPQGRTCGREFKIGNIKGEPGESLSINLSSGLWEDFATGKRGADLIDLRAAMIGGNKGAAARELAKTLGISVNGADRYPGKPPPPRPAEVEDWQPMVPPPDGTDPAPASTFPAATHTTNTRTPTTA